MNFKNFDLFNLNYEYCSINYGILNSSKDNLPKKGILLRILSLINATILLILRYKKRNILIPSKSVLFFGLNDNEVLPYSNILKLDNHHLIGNDRYINGFPLIRIYLTSFLFIPIVLFYFLTTKDNVRKHSFKYIFDFYCLTFAAILIIPNYLNKLKPKKL